MPAYESSSTNEKPNLAQYRERHSQVTPVRQKNPLGVVNQCLRSYSSLMRSLGLAPILLTCAGLAFSQSRLELPTNNSSPTPQGSSRISGTYNDTLQTIRKWIESEESGDLSRLLTKGEVRTADLMAACHNSEEEIARAAFGALQLLGEAKCEACAESLSQARGGVAVTCSGSISELTFERIERWLATKRKGTGYECGEDYEPLTPMDDSVVYALILDGSSRSQGLLEDMLGLEKACVADGPTIIGEALENAKSMIQAAKESGHILKVEPEKLKSSVRASAFFLPPKYRSDCEVEVISRNRARNRILLEVSYRCGNLCGKGYYVLLRKDGADWHYALIRMAWIS